ncbi:MAG TPA: transcriptional regulator [Lachnospiraceae bacterium]|nr:transcriptional regulator [Lachnospiraceae bacterium]
MNKSRLASKLKELRKAYSYTQEDVAAVLGVVRQTYSHYETGKRSPNFETLFKLAGLYSVSVDDLIQLTIDIDRNDYFDAPRPTTSSNDLSELVEYLNHPYNQKKLRFLTNTEKELIFFFEKISEKDKREILEFTRIKAHNM